MRIPTSRDIYLEADGRRIAAVQSYSAKSIRESRSIEVFGSTEPIATIGGRTEYQIELKKVMLLEQKNQEQVDFYDLDDFTLMIIRPDCRIIYTGCQWREIGEEGNLNQPCIERVSLVASRRLVRKLEGYG